MSPVLAQRKAQTPAGTAMNFVTSIRGTRHDRVNAQIKSLALDHDARLRRIEERSPLGRIVRQARRQNTLAELTLWYGLKDVPVLGDELVQQAVVVAPHAVDMALGCARLAIEVDGSWHDQARGRR